MSKPIIYHGTPMTPNNAFDGVMPGRAVCVSFYRPDQIDRAVEHCSQIMLDNGAFSFWQKALKAGNGFDATDRDWKPFYNWLEPLLTEPERWAVIPDQPGAPSQMNDYLLGDWPFGTEVGAPLWHMDGPISRLLRLCEKYSRVCFGWVGEIDAATNMIRADEKKVGCDAWQRKMDEVAKAFGNTWPNIHMMRGVAVARDYPFHFC